MRWNSLVGMIVMWPSKNLCFFCQSEIQAGHHRLQDKVLNIGQYGKIEIFFFSDTRNLNEPKWYTNHAGSFFSIYIVGPYLHVT